MRYTGAGPEGIDPGNRLVHPARGPVGRKAGVHFFEGTAVGEMRGREPRRAAVDGRRLLVQGSKEWGYGETAQGGTKERRSDLKAVGSHSCGCVPDCWIEGSQAISHGH